jgi:hypothetical protein
MEPESLWRQVWRPTAETLEAIAGVLRARWRDSRVRTPQQFWSTPGSWLRSRRQGNTTHHLTRGGKLIR